MRKILFQIEIPECPGCGKAIEDRLMSLKGVKSARVFHGLGKIRTEFDENETDCETIKEIINSLGHRAEFIDRS